MFRQTVFETLRPQNVPSDLNKCPIADDSAHKRRPSEACGQCGKSPAAWKGGLLFEGGRIIMIKVVLTASLVYHMLSFDLPPWVIKCIDKICRDFL